MPMPTTMATGTKVIALTASGTTTTTGRRTRSAAVLQPKRQSSGNINKVENKSSKAAGVKQSMTQQNNRRRSGAGGPDTINSGWTSTKLMPSKTTGATEVSVAVGTNCGQLVSPPGGTKLGSSNVNAMKRLPGRLQQPTIASALRAASNSLVAKKQQAKAANAATAIALALGGRERTIRQAKNVKSWDVGVERRRMRESSGGGNEKGANKALTASAKNAARMRLWPQRKVSNKDVVKATTKKERDATKHKDKNMNESHAMQMHDEAAHLTGGEAQRLQELGIQTNEAEILNHELLIGDIKLMMPSKEVVAEIEKSRNFQNKQKHQQQQKDTSATVRKQNKFDKQEETHLSELKEFMERNYITKRPKQRNTIYNQSAILKSMDDLLTREVPRAESITDIKDRIRRKEKELMSLFDNVDLNESSKSTSP